MPKKILNKEKWIPADKLNLPRYIRNKDGAREEIIGMLIVRNKEYLIVERRWRRIHRDKTMITTESHEIYVLNDVFPNSKKVMALQKEQHDIWLRQEKIRDELREEQTKLVKQIKVERKRIAGDYKFPYEEGEY